MSLRSRLANMLRTGRYESDLDRELGFHIEEAADALEAQGLSRADALLEARRRFGNRTALAEQARGVDLVGWLESILGDLRYGLRSLARTPGFAAVAIISLALGIGANTTIFTLVNAVLLRSLPIQRPEQLALVIHGENGRIYSNPLWEEIRDRAPFLGTLAYNDGEFNLAPGGPVRVVPGTWVSGSFFGVLGVHAIAGRLLTPADDRRGCTPTVVVSEGFSRREFGSPAAAIGRTLPMNGVTFAVIGVADGRFTGPTIGRSSEIFAPLCTIAAVEKNPAVLDDRSSWYINVMARVPDSLSLEAAGARLRGVSPAIMQATLPPRWRPEHHAAYLANVLTLRPSPAGHSEARQDYGGPLILLMIVVGVVLLIACANVANLLLARAEARQREMAIRMAIGAGKQRLLRQLLSESLLLSGFGAVAGILFANWASAALVRLLAVSGESVWLDLGPDWRVMGFAIGVAVLTGLLFGLAPAWRATRVDPQSAMKAQGRGIAGSRSRFRFARGLVVGQMALSLLLVVVAGLMLRSFLALSGQDTGFEREGVLLTRMDMANTGFMENAADSLTLSRRQVEHRLMLERVRALPGVMSASASLITPVSGSGWNEELVVEGFTPASEMDAVVWHNGVSEGYFATMGMELLEGRDMTSADGKGAPPVAVVSRSMAQKFFPGRSAVGQVFRMRLRESVSAPVTIVGVVEDAKYSRMDEDAPPQVYRPLYQAQWWGSALHYETRFAGQEADLRRAITGVAERVSSAIELRFITLEEQVAMTMRRELLLSLLSGFFGLLAVVLAVVGLYGTMAYGVARRRSEIGVRLALGARPNRVMSMILGEAGRLVAIGLIVGIAGALAATRVLGGILYGLEPDDRLTYVSAGLLLAAAALTAAAIPAWRAARLDPMTTLREE